MFKRLLRRLSAVTLMLAVCVCGVYYYLGYFDFSFIDRGHVLGGDSVFQPPRENTGNANPDDSLYPDDMDPEEADREYNEALMSAESGNLSDVSEKFLTDPGGSGGSSTPVPGESFFKKTDYYKSLGYKITDSVYDKKTHVLGEVALSVQVTDKYSQSVKSITYPLKSKASSDSEYVVMYETRRIKRPALDLYMGCIFYDTGEDFYLLSEDGEPISKIDINTYMPAYTRDKYDNPVFYAYIQVPDQYGSLHFVKTYYILSEDKKSLVLSDYDDAADNRGIYSDYPAYYGKQAEGYPERVYNTDGTWSYRGIWSSYAYAFAFTSDFACAANAKGEMSVINRYGQTAFPMSRTVANSVNKYVTELLLCVMPSSFGGEATGYFYFDHGLIRVREQRLEYRNYVFLQKKTVIYDREKLYKTDGTEFPVPYGYDIVTYSNGIILLEKDEKYGYMDYTGAWIAQPIYTDATTFSEGLAVLTLSNGKMGMIDTKGNIIIPFQYDYISPPSSGIISVYSEAGGWHVLQKMSRGD